MTEARRVLVARLDGMGDVILSGPAVRAVAAGGNEVTFLAGPSGAPAAALLPGVTRVEIFDAPWVGFDPPKVDGDAIDRLVAVLTDTHLDEGIILTSYHQSPLPLALLARLGGIPRLAAVGVDYPGSLLDFRVPYRPELHEVEQSLLVAAAAGHHLEPSDDGDLRLLSTAPSPIAYEPTSYVVVHPGASVDARRLPSALASQTVAALADQGWRVIVTGAHDDTVVDVPSGPAVTDVTGTTSLPELVALVEGAAAVVCGNTGIVHIAAAVGTPVVQAFAPVVPPHRWRPWRVPHRQLGSFDIGCAGCRSRDCPVPGQPCLAPVTVRAVVDAVDEVVESAWHARS